jgi:hypothetical protein
MNHDHHDHDHGDHDHGSHGAHGAETHAPVSVTINPEARVNVARTGAPLPEFPAGEWVSIPVAIFNQGFVTGPLAIVQTRPVPGIELDLPQHPLTGRDHEVFFRVRFEAPAVVDVELRFYALGALGGLADHNTLALLLRCEGGELAHVGHGAAGGHADHGDHEDHGHHGHDSHH